MTGVKTCALQIYFFHTFSITFDKNEEEHIVKCDGECMERIMLNLLSNAIKYTPMGGEIFVNLDFSDAYVYIQVKGTAITHREGRSIIILSPGKSYLISCNLTVSICDLSCTNEINVIFLLNGRPYPGMSSQSIYSENQWVTITGNSIIKANKDAL